MDITGKLLNPNEIQINEPPVKELADMLRLRKVPAMGITLRFIHRAGVARKLVCLPPQNAPSQCRLIA